MKYLKSSSAAVLHALLAIVLIFESCKENTIINANVTPAIDNIRTFGIGPEFNNGTDTITILTKTIRDDSLITSGSISGQFIHHALGYVNADPWFGTTQAGIFMQVVPTSTGLDYTTSGNTIDSAVLILPYSGFTWGDTSGIATQKFNVYRITDSLSRDSVYYAFSNKNTDPAPIGTATIQIGGSGSIKDSVTVRTTTRAPHLRVKMTPAFLADFNAIIASKADTTFASFLRVFPGFYIAPDITTSSKALPYFRLDGYPDAYGQANLLVYAHNASTDSITYSFPFNGNYTAHFNRITRVFNSTINNIINSGLKSDSTLFLQNLPGASIDLRFPFVKSLPANVIINKAVITLTRISTDNEDIYSSPDRIYPRGINASGARYDVVDRFPLSSTAGIDFVDGTPRKVTIGGFTITQYNINIPRELQQAIIQQKSELHLRINGVPTYPGAYRLVAGGWSGGASRISLNIIYSKQ